MVEYAVEVQWNRRGRKEAIETCRLETTAEALAWEYRDEGHDARVRCVVHTRAGEFAMSIIDTIRPGDRVTILVSAGLRFDRQSGKVVQEYKRATGRAVMRSSAGGWLLDLGGRYGRPGLADAANVVAVARLRRRGG
jgi:hypothetical protein